jgi:hypothetical protein
VLEPVASVLLEVDHPAAPPDLIDIAPGFGPPVCGLMLGHGPLTVITEFTQQRQEVLSLTTVSSPNSINGSVVITSNTPSHPDNLTRLLSLARAKRAECQSLAASPGVTVFARRLRKLNSTTQALIGGSASRGAEHRGNVIGP